MDRIVFFKVENDGFNLGAQRRPIDKNDLPQVRAEITDYLGQLRRVSRRRPTAWQNLERCMGLSSRRRRLRRTGSTT